MIFIVGFLVLSLLWAVCGYIAAGLCHGELVQVDLDVAADLQKLPGEMSIGDMNAEELEFFWQIFWSGPVGLYAALAGRDGGPFVWKWWKDGGHREEATKGE